MSKDSMITAQGSETQAKPVVAKPTASKPAVSKPRTSKPKSTKTKSRVQAKTVASAPTEAATKKADKAVSKVSKKAAGRKRAPAKPAKKVAAAKPVSAKPAAQKEESASTAPLDRSLQAAMPVAVAVNTKLVDIAHSNVSAGLELARDLAGAKTPMEAMRLGVAYWFNHIGAIQAQARELQSLSAAWVKTASRQIRTL